ncbi:hypothetical protein HDV01_006949 [Terramyces sp. JEL0728]|nr:hypothetical protein HDV01_006949 [Terramyces sp. JEL0728]
MFWKTKSAITGHPSEYVFVITGCDTGIGLELVKQLSPQGFVVYAGCYSQTGLEAINALGFSTAFPILLDVTKQEQIDDFVKIVKEKHQSIFCLINNAGILNTFYLEWGTVEQIQRMFDVNLFGQIRMCKAFVPLLRTGKNGRIINISSVASFIPMGGLGGYSASKAASRMYSNCMRMELGNFGIHVITAMPGGFNTNIQAQEATIKKNFDEAPQEIKDIYGQEYCDSFVKAWTATASAFPKPGIAAKQLIDCALKDTPPLDLPVGTDAVASWNTIPLLGDKLYEKRKQAALEIEKLVRDAVQAKDHTRITLLLQTLVQDFTYSIVPNSRNGGLIALAATAIALGGLVQIHLKQIVPPILTCFADHDSRVRYYACESMYNVGKVARHALLGWFNEIFDALTKLSIDPELSVKNGAELLDRLIKDIVCEKPVYYHPEFEQEYKNLTENGNTLQISGGGDHPLSASPTPNIFPPVPGSIPLQPGMTPLTFNLPRFIPLLKERINVVNAPGRLFLVQWILVLNSVPDLELVTFLPEFLDGLFVYLSDTNVDVRTATLNVLGEFLKEISSISSIQRENGPLKFVSPEKSNPANPYDTSVELAKVLEEKRTGQVANDPYIPGQGVMLDFGKMTETLVKYLPSKDEETQATSLRWVNSFIVLAKSAMLPFTSQLLGAILPILSHQIDTIRSLAIDANTNLFTLVLEWSMHHSPSKIQDDPFDIVNTVGTLLQLFQDEHEDTRVGSLEWLLMLHKKYPKKVMNADQTIFQGLLKTLSDYSEEVVRRDLQLLAQISHSSDDEYFTKFMINLMNLFTIDRRLLETRGSLIVRQLCLSLNAERMYRSFGEILAQEEDLEFASTMVQTLNLILITAPELAEMRQTLKNIESREGSALFSALYRSWCHNPIAVFSLCLLAQAYEHASNLMTSFGELEITVQFLIQTDKLVQLIESPVFTQLRLQLLEPDRYPYLYKCLYGILMLLPQSSAFSTLRNRLNSVNTLAMLYASPPTPMQSPPPPTQSRSVSKKLQTPEPTNNIVFKWGDFLQHFRNIQARHERARRNLSRAQTHQEDEKAFAKRGRSGSVPPAATSTLPSLSVGLSRFSRVRPPTSASPSSYDLRDKPKNNNIFPLVKMKVSYILLCASVFSAPIYKRNATPQPAPQREHGGLRDAFLNMNWKRHTKRSALPVRRW